MKRTLLPLLLILAFSFTASAETSLWVVEKDGRTTYIGGTCHVLRPTDFPLPEEFEAAYADARLVVFEADPGRLNSPEVQKAIAAKALLPGETTLEQILKPETYQALREYCAAAGIPLEALKKLKPSMLSLTLLAVELKKLGLDQGGVDHYFYGKAVADQKKIDALETVEQQLDFLLTMGENDADRFIEYSLQDMDQIGEAFEVIIAAWRTGDESRMENLILADIRDRFPDIYKTLFSDRNAAWLPAIEKYIRTPEKELVLVGAGHLVGRDGVIASLRQRGYEVRRMKAPSE